MTFQAMKMKFLNSKTLQVFPDLYEPGKTVEKEHNHLQTT